MVVTAARSPTLSQTRPTRVHPQRKTIAHDAWLPPVVHDILGIPTGALIAVAR